MVILMCHEFRCSKNNCFVEDLAGAIVHSTPGYLRLSINRSHRPSQMFFFSASPSSLDLHWCLSGIILQDEDKLVQHRVRLKQLRRRSRSDPSVELGLQVDPISHIPIFFCGVFDCTQLPPKKR